MENPITGIGEEGKLKCRKIEKKVQLIGQERQAGILKIIKNSQPKQEKDKLEFPKLKFQPFIYSYAYIYNIISGFYINFTLQENILTS